MYSILPLVYLFLNKTEVCSAKRKFILSQIYFKDQVFMEGEANSRCQTVITGEGNGSPLQYSCLENPVDRGAWWAAVCP